MAGTFGVLLLLAAAALTAAMYYVDSVPTPVELELPESTTVYFADGTTPMATLGTENRTLLEFVEMNEAVKQAIVAAEDRTFWTNDGIDIAGVARAAWNNVTKDTTEGASTITQQYARIAADLTSVTYSRKVREAIMAWKLTKKHSKEEILEFYLNTVPFGRGAYGIEAAADAFMGKTANRTAPLSRQVTVAEAMVLAAMVKQPEADPDDPAGRPGYDPTRSERALQNSRARWTYIRDGMVELGYLTPAEADDLVYPLRSVTDYEPSARQSGLRRPTGFVVQRALSELRTTPAFRGKPEGYLENGGFRIVTTIDKRIQEQAEAAADIERGTAPAVARGQPENWQAALVAVQPGSGQVLAYYGGNDGTGADHAGWHLDADGDARGFGQHPPGSSFKVYALAEALRQEVSLLSRWDSPATKEFPASGRTWDSPAGPVRNASRAACQPSCTLVEAAVASLNVPFFDLTEKLGATHVIEMAHRAGIESMWTSPRSTPPVRVDLARTAGSELSRRFSTEVGIGQYGITVADHANGMATFAAGGRRATAHVVLKVTRDDVTYYTERITGTDIGLSGAKVNELTWTLSRVAAARLSNGWDAAGKTGTWQAGASRTRNAHTWMVGYTRVLAAAVWLGTKDGKALVTHDGKTNVYGSSHAAPIWRQFMEAALTDLRLDPEHFRFARPGWAVELDPAPRPAPTRSPVAQPSPDPVTASVPPVDPTVTIEPTAPEITVGAIVPARRSRVPIPTHPQRAGDRPRGCRPRRGRRGRPGG